LRNLFFFFGCFCYATFPSLLFSFFFFSSLNPRFAEERSTLFPFKAGNIIVPPPICSAEKPLPSFFPRRRINPRLLFFLSSRAGGKGKRPVSFSSAWLSGFVALPSFLFCGGFSVYFLRDKFQTASFFPHTPPPFFFDF